LPIDSPESDGSEPVRETSSTVTDRVDDLDVLVAMPAYNEARTVGSVVRAVRPYADAVLVVDDGSGDATAVEADRAGALVVSHPVNRGYGGALKTIFSRAATHGVTHLVVIDADGQHNPADIPRLVAEQVETGANVVIGSRFATGAATDAPLYRRFGLWVINTLTNLSLGAYRPAERLSDVQSGFRAYDATTVRSLAAAESIGDCMAASLDILYHVHRNGYTVSEVGTTITYDVDHASCQDPLTQGFGLVSAICVTTVRDRPLFALGVPGAVASLFGLFVPFFFLTPVTSVGLVRAFLLVTLCGFGLCGLGLHRHLSTRGRRASEPASSSPPHTLSED
jgi:hypothetical protein